MIFSVALLFVSYLILKGKKENKHSKFLIDQLQSNNYHVEKVSVVAENVNIVANELDVLSKQYDVLIIVNESNDGVVMRALNNLSCEHSKSSTGEHSSEEAVQIPVAVKLLGKNSTYPVLYIQRIFVLNSDTVEVQFFEHLQEHLQQYQKNRTYTKIFDIQMNGLTKELCYELQSYKSIIKLDETEGVYKATISGKNFEDIVEHDKLLQKKLGDYVIDSYEENDLLTRIYESDEKHIQQTIQSIKKCLSTYGPENVFLCFNGGKDCTVLLHLVYVVLKMVYPNYKNRLFCQYVKSKEAFPEQDEFISQCQIFYNLDIMTVSLGIKESLEKILTMKQNLKACFMGTRRTDPHSSNLQVFQMTDPGWPRVMRASPILDWHYCDIWDYLLFYKVPYCKLYDMGFTSLGNISNTVKNPSLSYWDGERGENVYLPAYKMMNEAKERIGRDTKSSSSSSS